LLATPSADRPKGRSTPIENKRAKALQATPLQLQRASQVKQLPLRYTPTLRIHLSDLGRNGRQLVRETRTQLCLLVVHENKGVTGLRDSQAFIPHVKGR
jgi:hypothetical protein